MPRNRPGRRRRRRGGRGEQQAGESTAPQEERQERAPEDGAGDQDSAAAPEGEAQRAVQGEQGGRAGRIRRRGRSRRRDHDHQGGVVSSDRHEGEQETSGDTGSGRTNRRSQRGRQPRRRQVFGPSPLEVLKERPRTHVPQPDMTKRTVDAISNENGTQAGCPMLSRTKLGLPTSGGRQVPRCSLGWAIHSEDEALNCMLTPKVIDCWKEHPEAYKRLMEQRNRAAAD